MDNTLKLKNYLQTRPMIIRILSALVMFTLLAVIVQLGYIAFGIGIFLLNCGIFYEIFKISSNKNFGIKFAFYFYCMGALLCMFLLYYKMGPAYFLWLVSLVTFNDTAALIVGKKLQGPKLCPKISPNKTQSGFFGGIIIGSVLSVFSAHFLTLTFSYNILIVAIILSLASHLGDLLESAFKRYFDIKDSSHIIPGHGGILDRIDSLMLVSIVFFCFFR